MEDNIVLDYFFGFLSIEGRQLTICKQNQSGHKVTRNTMTFRLWAAVSGQRKSSQINEHLGPVSISLSGSRARDNPEDKLWIVFAIHLTKVELHVLEYVVYMYLEG